MAGRGPAPKPAGQRRNKHAPQRGEWVDLGPLEKPVLPELPDGEWGEWSRLMWNAWRADPVTSQYSEADIAYALETIRLYETGKGANEVRLRLDSLGLTPKGKRDLRWRVVPEGPAAEVRPIASARRLKAVDPGAVAGA